MPGKLRELTWINASRVLRGYGIVDQGGMTAKPSSVSRWYCSWSRLSSLAPHSLASRGALSGPKAKSATATGWDMALYVLMVLLALVGIYLFYAVIHPERF